MNHIKSGYKRVLIGFAIILIAFMLIIVLR